MQLIKWSLLILFVPFLSLAQSYRPLEDKEINFLSNYYTQEGNHSPVTGGIGDEKLDCIAPLTIINIPLDSLNTISVTGGLDYYSSASCNKIDLFVGLTSASSRYMSSASSNDTRGHGDIAYTRKFTKSKSSLGGMLGYSQEFDVISFAAGMNYNKSSKSENTDLTLKATMYYDIWKLIYPGEIRGLQLDNVTVRFGNEDEDYDSDSRITSTFTASIAQVLTRRLQFLVTSDFVVQNGILNTPFHRVYFNDGIPLTDSTWYMKLMRPEKLPRHRIKVAVGVRANYFLSDIFTLRLYYRYYWDDFDLSSNTYNIELPIKISQRFTLYPSYRYYVQKQAKYFKPFGEHEIVRDANGDPVYNIPFTSPILDFTTPVDQYYTSDYDLSSFVNHKFGFGIRYNPVFGVAKWKMPKIKSVIKEQSIKANPKTTVTFKYIELKYALYNRSDGLKAHSVSLDCGFVF